MNTTESLASAVTHAITVDARKRTKIGSSRDWTQAIWDSLKVVAEKRDLFIYPKDGPYKGEYHLDFILWQDGYGPLVGIESQWLHWRQKDPLNSNRMGVRQTARSQVRSEGIGLRLGRSEPRTASSEDLRYIAWVDVQVSDELVV